MAEWPAGVVDAWSRRLFPEDERPEDDDPTVWLRTILPDYFPAAFADHHLELWNWIWALRAGTRPAPFVAIWPRGGAKSTSAEAGVLAVAARQARRYGLYVCETQDQADDHVQNIAVMLESAAVARHYPALARRMVSKYGHSRGWRRNRLRTAAGFTVDALGLDTAARGVKIDEQRPDLLVLDDLDSEHDTAAKVARKIRTLTRAVLPTGADDLAVLAIQNLVHPDSIFAQLADGRADFLAGRRISGPVPAVQGFAVERRAGRYMIVDGTPTWEGKPIEACQADLDDWGLTAFMSEAQHDVEAPPGGMYDHLDFDEDGLRVELEQLPPLVRTVVWVDPAVTAKDGSDSQGIQADGIDQGGVIYRLRSWEGVTTPLEALKRAIRWGVDLDAQTVGVETDQGGDTWKSVYWQALDELGVDRADAPGFRSAKAGEGHGGKVERSARMLADYERGSRIRHVIGTHAVLERALKRFPKTKPLDLADAAYWAWQDLRRSRARAKVRVRTVGRR